MGDDNQDLLPPAFSSFFRMQYWYRIGRWHLYQETNWSNFCNFPTTVVRAGTVLNFLQNEVNVSWCLGSGIGFGTSLGQTWDCGRSAFYRAVNPGLVPGCSSQHHHFTGFREQKKLETEGKPRTWWRGWRTLRKRKSGAGQALKCQRGCESGQKSFPREMTLCAKLRFLPYPPPSSGPLRWDLEI